MCCEMSLNVLLLFRYLWSHDIYCKCSVSMMHFGLKSHRRPDRPFLPRCARLGNVRPCPIHQSNDLVNTGVWTQHRSSTSAHGQEACTTYKHVPGIVGEKSSSSPGHALLRWTLARLYYPTRSWYTGHCVRPATVTSSRGLIFSI